MNAPRSTVAIVLNYCREDLTAECIISLERSTARPRVLIVDNASPDGSGERLRQRFPDHDFLQTGENLGYAGGNARGITWALEQGAERVFVVNDDAELSAHCLAFLHDALDRDAQAAAASPTMLHATPAGRVWWAGGRFSPMRALAVHEHAGEQIESAPWREDPPRAVTSLCGCAMLIRGDVIRESGGFREDFWAYAEDVELSLRYVRAGWRLLHVPQARLVHKVPDPEPPPAGWKIAYRDRNRRRIAALHLRGSERLAFWAFFLPSRLLLLAKYVLTFDFGRAAGIWRGLTAGPGTRIGGP
ncbi:MAG: glycosyltransferase family 2 protein [Gemmatimonadaceae bacterium]|nr:glycosyltransferase family 2 protein [Gemmatimonadaceae bacterium]